jgi:hypothetical protein
MRRGLGTVNVWVAPADNSVLEGTDSVKGIERSSLPAVRARWQSGDHAARMARFAIAALRVAGSTLIDPDDPARGPVRIRVGMHSGHTLTITLFQTVTFAYFLPRLTPSRFLPILFSECASLEFSSFPIPRLSLTPCRTVHRGGCWPPQPQVHALRRHHQRGGPHGTGAHATPPKHTCS